MSESDSVDRLQRAIDAYVTWTRGEPREPVESFLTKYDDLRDLLEPMLGESAPAETGESERVLGDYRLLREIGRGGMGVVYEAHQISLGRRVAIKVLPEHVLHPAALARFKREASVAAMLQHPGIVGVHEFGHEGDVHFIAMEFVEGAPLDAVVRATSGGSLPEIDGQRVQDSIRDALHRPSATTVEHPDDTATATRVFCRSYVETIIRIVVQVADALAHAHAQGVIHRDVKPANILVRVDGTVVLTDFGLAKQEDRPSLTQTGDFAGTPHYVSPEQILGKHAPIDGRTDVFSLGATLYELLTHRRPFDGDSTPQILANILGREPKDPVRWNPSLPDDLSAIVLKTLEKEPPSRYASAAELAADLRAFLEYRPVAARRASTARKLRRWIKREPLKAGLVALGATFLIVVGILGISMISSRAAHRRATEGKIDEALTEARVARGVGDFATALAAAERARAVLEGEQYADLAKRVAKLHGTVAAEAEAARAKAELETRNAKLLRALEEIRQPEEDPYYPVVWKDVATSYGALFESDGLPLLAGEEQRATELLAARGAPVELAGMVDAWARVEARAGDTAASERLTRIARAVDRDAQRATLRGAILAGDTASLQRLAKDTRAHGTMPAPTLELLAGTLLRMRQTDLALAVYRRAHGRHRGDYVLAVGLARALLERKPPLLQEAARAYAAALALEPASVEVRHELGRLLHQELEEHARAVELLSESVELRPEDGHLRWHLGNALADAERVPEAIEVLREATKLEPGFASGWLNLAVQLNGAGRHDEAEKAVREALRLDEESGTAWLTLGNIQLARGDTDAAIKTYRAGLKRDFQTETAHAQTWAHLGAALARKERIGPALRAMQEAVRIDPDNPMAHRNLGEALRMVGRLEESERIARKAVALEPDDPQTYFHLHYTLLARKRPADALTELKKSFGLGQDAEAHFHVGEAYDALGKPAKAAEAFGAALAAQPDFPQAGCMRAFALQALGRYDEALTALQSAREKTSWKRVGLPVEQWIAQAEKLCGLSRIVRGKRVPGGAAEAIAASELAQEEGRSQRAAELRGNALVELRAEIAKLQERAQASDPARREVAAAARRLLADPQLASVRAKAIAALPVSERGDWRTLWQRAAALASAK